MMDGVRTLVLFVVVAVVGLAGVAGLASNAQRSASQTTFEQTRAAQQMLTAMIDQETGLRGYILLERRSALEPYDAGRRDYEVALARLRAAIGRDAGLRRAVTAADRQARAWMGLARVALRDVEANLGEERRTNTRAALRRKAQIDGFRARNARLQTLVAARQERLDRHAMTSTVIAVAVLGGVFALVGGLVARRQAVSTARRRARERRYQEGQRDLGTGLQVAHSEPEAHTFLQRHLEHVVPASSVTVLTRHGAANRLRAGTELPAGSPLRDPLAKAEPGSCLAVRLARRRQGSDDYEGVLRCEICHQAAPLTDCTPLVVGGEVIGSVLVAHEAPLTPDADRAIEDSVGQAAPVLANLRNLAIAESRAATDGLTGLPNRRSFEDQLRRMAAQAGRTMQPLSAVALDIDHFKAINDVHGHARGDEVLAQIGSLMPSVLRVSDFVARVGGEEFVALLPDTSRDGALVIAEKLRSSVAGLELPGLGRQVTISLGVAVLPDDATKGQDLLREADRMLYVAKERGRNRVETSLGFAESDMMDPVLEVEPEA